VYSSFGQHDTTPFAAEHLEPARTRGGDTDGIDPRNKGPSIPCRLGYRRSLADGEHVPFMKDRCKGRPRCPEVRKRLLGRHRPSGRSVK